MGSITHLISIVLGFVSVLIGVFSRKKKWLFYPLIALGIILCAYPFINYSLLTGDAYDWKIVVSRELDAAGDPKVIFIQDIEWITDYRILKKRRGYVRSLLLDEDTTRKVWKVHGYIPVAIDADIIYGTGKYTITRNFSGLPPGSYTFTLKFDENDVGMWSIEATD